MIIPALHNISVRLEVRSSIRMAMSLRKLRLATNIVYTSPNNMTTDDYLLYADRIVSVFDVKADEFSSSDLKNAYIAYTSLLDTDDPHYGCRHLFSESEWNSIQNGSMTSSKQTQLLYERITDEDIDELSNKEKATYVIYSRMTTVNSSSYRMSFWRISMMMMLPI